MNSEIPDGELFADLQQSLTDITLIEMLDNKSKYEERLGKEKKILEAIKKIMKDRFSEETIERFLELGYPRQVDLTKKI